MQVEQVDYKGKTEIGRKVVASGLTREEAVKKAQTLAEEWVQAQFDAGSRKSYSYSPRSSGGTAVRTPSKVYVVVAFEVVG